MTKITEQGAAARLAKLTADVETDLALSIDKMSPKEVAELIDQEWNDTPLEEQQRLLWIARKNQEKTLRLVAESRKDELAAANQNRLMVAGTDEVVRKLHGFYTLDFPDAELFLAISPEPPREVVLVRAGPVAPGRTPRWTHLVVGKRRYRLKTTGNPNVWRCKGLSHAAFQDALNNDPHLKVSVL